VQQLGGFALGRFAATVVAGGSLHVGMAGEVLRGGEAGAQAVAGEVLGGEAGCGADVAVR
jgi:hypothetical protein